MRLLFVYKNNWQDPCLQALKRWLPRAEVAVSLFEFHQQERQRGKDSEKESEFQRLSQVVEQFQPTHILSWVPYINLREVIWFKSQGIKVGIAVNGVASLSSGITSDQKQYFEMLQELDYYFVPHRPHVPILRSFKINAFEMPFFYDPDIYKPLPMWQRLWRIGGTNAIFIGNFGPVGNLQRPHRQGLINALAPHLRVRLISDFSIDRPGIRWTRPIPFPRVLNWLINRSHIAICYDFFPDVTVYNDRITNIVAPYGEQDQFTIRSRQFTMMGAGAAVMVERHPEIQRFFKDGQEIILWENIEEAVERAIYFVNNPDKLAVVARRGHGKVARLHTAPLRIRQIVATMMGETPPESVEENDLAKS